MNVNPFLADAILSYRSARDESALRNRYKAMAAVSEGLSWEDFLMDGALEEAMETEPLLKTLRCRMDLSERTKEGLYRIRVDTLADLLQVTKEELSALSREAGFDEGEVKDYLCGLGLRLRRAPGRTLKVPSLRVIGKCHPGAMPAWAIPSPGWTTGFDPSRPTLYGNWLSEYCRRNELFEGERKSEGLFEAAPPPVLDEMMADDYKEFFGAAGTLFDSYMVCCSGRGLHPKVDRPPRPCEDVRHVYREGFRAVVDILERTTLLRYVPAGEYIHASDEGRLNIAERNMHDDGFQMLIISLVEMKIDLENIVTFLQECMEGKREDIYSPRPRAREHPFAGMIRTLRERFSDGELRQRYLSALEDDPQLSWEEFIVQAALAEPGAPTVRGENPIP